MNRLACRNVALALVLAAAGAAHAQPQKITIKKLAPLTLGLTGYGGAEGARADSEQIQKYLQAKLSREVTTRVFADAPALSKALASGEIDLGWMQPFTVVEALKAGRVEPLVKAVRHGLPFYRGVVFARADRKLAPGLKGLGGLSIGWVNETSSAGYLFPKAAFVQGGHSPAKLLKKQEFLKDHSLVCRAVLDGKVDLGATFADDRPAGEKMVVDGCVQSVGAEEASKLQIVLTSAPIPNDAIVARPGLPADDAARIRKAFGELKADTDGRVLLGAVFKAEGFEDVGAEDFEPVKFAAEAATK